MTNLERFNQHDIVTVGGGHDDHSFSVIRRKVTDQFLRKLASSANSVIFDLFSVILTNLERFNQNGVFTVEGGHDDHSFPVIRRKVTEQF